MVATPENALNITTAGLVKFDGTATFSGVTTTNHNLLIGATSNGITNVAPSATSGIPVISQGSSADPTFGTAVVAGGGTGIVTTTAYGILAGGTTSTGAFQNIGTGTTGQLLISQGNAALPTYVNSNTVGSWVEVGKLTASNSATLNFTSFISASYNTYVLIFSNVVPITNNAILQMQVSTNNGSTYINTNYFSGFLYFPYNSTTQAQASSTSLILLTQAIANTAPGAGGTVWLYNAQNGQNFMFLGTANFFSTGGPFYGNMFGYNTATSTNAFQITMSSGNISTGTFTLYGISET